MDQPAEGATASSFPGSNASTALGWVREDLDRLVEKARKQIENAAVNPNSRSEALKATGAGLEHLAQTLHALSLHGASMLVEEMEALCDNIIHYRVEDRDKAFQALMDAIVVLPSYLDRIQAGHRDMPLLLLPAINTMRASHGASQLQDSTVFAPDLDTPLPDLGIEAQEQTRDESFRDFAIRMRQQFENALLNWLQDQESLEHLAPIQGICETLLHRVKRPDQRRLWWVASEIIGGLEGGYTRNDAAFRRLFARLHLALKALSEKGEDATDARSVDGLTRAFLFLAAQARRGNAGIDLVRKTFDLENQVPDQEELLRAQGSVSGRNREMYLSLGSALQDELALVKDALDLELRTGEVDAQSREASYEILDRLQDTLRMLGLIQSAQALEALLPEIEASSEASPEDRESALMALAGRILMIESALNEQIETLGEPLDEPAGERFIELPLHEQRRIENHLLDEMVVSLYAFQDAVKKRFGGDASAELEAPLELVAGALELLGDTRVAELTRRFATVTHYLLRNAYSESAVDRRDLEALTDAAAALELYLASCRDRQSNRDRYVAVLEERLEALPDSPESAEEIAARRAAAPKAAPKVIETVREEPVQTGEDVLPPEMDAELLEVFLEEYESVAEAFHLQIPDWLDQLDNKDLLTDIRRGFHTLKGSGRMVGAHELGDFCWQIEDLLNHLLDRKIDAYADVAIMVRLAQASLPALKQRLLQQPVGLSVNAIAAIGRHAERLCNGDPADWPGLHAQLPAFLAGMLPESSAAAASAPARDDSESDGLRHDLAEHLAPVQSLLEQVSNDRSARTGREHLRAIHTVAGALSMAPEGKQADIARALEGLLEAQSTSGHPFSLEAVWALGSGMEHLQARLDRLNGQADAQAGDDEDVVLKQILAITQDITNQPPLPQPAETEEPAAAEDAPDTPEVEAEPLDPDIVAIFLEEAHEVLARADSLLNGWRDELDKLDIVRNLQREIHTFKGGARMAGLSALGDLSHAMESLLERIAERSLPPSISAIQALETACDRLQSWVGQVDRGKVPDPGSAISLFEQQVEDLRNVPVQAPRRAPAEPEQREEQALPEAAPQPSNRSDETSGQAYIRVAADLLDSLVNAAGEVSIFRSRMAQQIENLRGSLGEFDETISRLREQFRKLEIETEAQIRSRYSDEAEAGTDGFDPLELDRFSSMQQLSRGLSESVSDLLNLQEMLEDSARHSENLLNQQSRFTTELQEGLMKTRMVPFGSVAPRLRRLVRAAAGETRKKARLQLKMVGTSDQLDRNVLERITAPLEHMLRNAIVHGIETPDQRKERGKDPEGDITITVESETTEFIIRIADDGAGIDLDAIRRKAVERGLLDADADPPDQQLLEFILDSGFSTSETVTGLAGRGVGMDVVNSEIKQIGGSLEITSEAGKGTCFTIRIPFTLAVMQAIGVLAGENRYLVPLASVGGVARLMPDDYLELLEHEQPVYRFAGEEYPVLELESLLGERPQPLAKDNVSLLMIRAGDHKAAFRVPQLLGHREIIIKPVGPQISSVPGILGGTVSADGKVVVILDMGPLIRHALMHGVRPAPAAEIDTRPRKTLAMVVDDSITMRKVTSRVLESHNFDIITAKDGVDATEQMQERIPDLLLLDIEMPRMDGYEVAENVRADPRLRHIPIVMITSRSGQKHRDRAERAGANAYLTKPYKESELITQVNELLGRKDQT
ncbi:MAG: response regulator [Xanthomonadales bacterium]|nr:response regulator [Xanthomonadales bacterium]